MNKPLLTKRIKKEGITDENVKLFQQTYDVNTNHIHELIHEFCIVGNKKVLEYYRKMEAAGVEFSIEQYFILKEFRTRNSKDSSSREFFQANYGNDWERFFNAKILATSGSLESFQLRHGTEIGRQKFEEANRNKYLSLENMIKRYGEDIGRKRWNDLCERNKGNLSLERMIKLYGHDEGQARYENVMWKLKNKNTLDYYVMLFGEEEGEIRYYERNRKNSVSTLKNSIRVVGTPAYEKYRKAKEEAGEWIPLSSMSEFETYYREAWAVTRKQPLHELKNFEKRDHQRVLGSYAVDHIISLKAGFLKGIHPTIIGRIDNLQMLPHSENSRKRAQCYCVIGAK